MSQIEQRQLFHANDLSREIAARGYAEFEHHIPSEIIEIAVDTYTRFTLSHPDPLPDTMSAMLPETSVNLEKALDGLDRTKDTQSGWHKYRTNVEGVGKPDGYTNRTFQVSALARARGVALDDDPKEFFHYSRRWLVNVNKAHVDNGWGLVPPEILELEKAFLPIHQKAAELTLKIASSIEDVHPEIRDYFRTPDIATSPIRLLFYHPNNKEVLGEGHYDKSSLTLQLAESHKGLRIAPDKNAELQLVTRDSSKAAFFPGRRVREEFSEDTVFQPAWHDVVRTNELNHGRSLSPIASEVCTRWALIFFANGSNYKNPDKSLTHTR